MKIHILANPRNPTGLMYRVDPFAVHAYKYIKHLSPHFEMVHYGIPGAQVDCEHVDLNCNPGDIKEFNRLAGREINKRASSGDIIVCFYGVDNKGACDANPRLKVIEPSIGYRSNGVFAPYRVFTSYAQMHMYYGERGMLMSPSWYDDVIGNPFTLSEFEYKEEKDDYFLYFGRVCKEKGVDLAIQATEKMGKKLKIAGPGSLADIGYPSTPSHVEHVGVAGPELRNELMRNAKALFGLTYYVEPFGNMIIEANLCGTPVITTDWGAFPEIVKQGITGFRTRKFPEILSAMEQVSQIKPSDCRAHGENFSDEKIHALHKAYIDKVIKNSFYE